MCGGGRKAEGGGGQNDARVLREFQDSEGLCSLTWDFHDGHVFFCLAFAF